jgi:3-oxoacyl-[acyl-carrier-protein] synthase III
VRTLFGDAAAATLVEAASGEDMPAPFILGTNGKGAANLMVPAGGIRTPSTPETAQAVDDGNGNMRSRDNLFMNGADVFSFTLRVVPDCVNRLLARANVRLEDVDCFVFHQANRYMLEHLRKKMGIPEEKFCLCLSHCGNTVSSTIPIALKHAALEGRLKDGQLVMLVGFGVGYSWGATLLRWPWLGL